MYNIYNPNYDGQNWPFYRLKLLVGSKIWTLLVSSNPSWYPQVVKLTNEKVCW